MPTRPLEEIVQEYVNAFWQLYEPKKYLEPTFCYFLKLSSKQPAVFCPPSWTNIRALLILFGQQGLIRQTWWRFWINLGKIAPLGILTSYLIACATIEHFIADRQLVHQQI